MVDQDRSLLKLIVLSFLTFGIYGLVFWHRYICDTNTVCSGEGKETPGLLKFILLSTITLGIYSFFWHYNLGSRLYDTAQNHGLNVREDGSIILLWMVCGSFIFGIGTFVAYYILIKNLNTIAADYNNYNANNPQA